jgi:hypothetical protein
MTASNAPRRGQSVSALLETATQVFRVTLLKCLPFAMIAVLIVDIPNFYWVASGHSIEHGLPTEPVYLWLSGITEAIALYIGSAMMLRQLYFSGGFAVNARQELTLAARRFPSLLASFMLMYVSLIVGFVLAIVPGIFLLVCYLVLVPVVLLEGQLNPVYALRRCIVLVGRNWWRVCAAFVIASIGIVVCLLVAGAILGIVANLFAGQGPIVQAITAAGVVAIGAVVIVFFSALALAVHSSASNSA